MLYGKVICDKKNTKSLAHQQSSNRWIEFAGVAIKVPWSRKHMKLQACWIAIKMPPQRCLQPWVHARTGNPWTKNGTVEPSLACCHTWVETPGLTLPWQHPKHVGSRQLQEATRLCCSTGKLARTSVSSDTPSSGQAKWELVGGCQPWGVTPRVGCTCRAKGPCVANHPRIGGFLRMIFGCAFQTWVWSSMAGNCDGSAGIKIIWILVSLHTSFRLFAISILRRQTDRRGVNECAFYHCHLPHHWQQHHHDLQTTIITVLSVCFYCDSCKLWRQKKFTFGLVCTKRGKIHITCVCQTPSIQ